MPRFDKPFTVHVNTSDVAIGVVLTQKVDDMDMPACYYSKRLNETESRWSIYERELYAIVQALGNQQCYLVNRDTVVYSNHQPLQYLYPSLNYQQNSSGGQTLQLTFRLKYSTDLISITYNLMLYHDSQHHLQMFVPVVMLVCHQWYQNRAGWPNFTEGNSRIEVLAPLKKKLNLQIVSSYCGGYTVVPTLLSS